MGIRWKIAVLLCVITTINYIDRQAFAVAGPVILEEFGLSNREFGAIGSAFLFAYAIGHLVVGPVIDRVGTRRAFSLAVIAWSLVGILHAAGRGFWSFLTLRGLLGLTEAANFPAALKTVAEWFPAGERSLAVGIVTVGPGLGAMISPPLLGYLILAFGWPWAFILPGLAGFAWLLIWRVYYHPPETHPGLSDSERQLICAGRERDTSPGHHGPWYGFFAYLRYRQVWGLLLSRFSGDGAFYFYVMWLPLYLYQARGFDIKQIALFAWVPFVAADLGSLVGGWFGARLVRMGVSIDRSRKLLIWLGVIMVLMSLPAVRVESPALAIALIGLAMFGLQFKAASLFSLPADLFPARIVASIWGLFGAAGSFGGMLFVAYVGWASNGEAYGAVFAAVGITQVLSAVLISLLIPRICQIDII